MSLLQDIVCEIADREGVSPVALETPLNTILDPDALEALISGTDPRQDDADVVVEFTYYGYAVEIDGSGTVTVSDQSDTTGESPGAESNRSLEALSLQNAYREAAMKEVADIIAARERPFLERLDGLLEAVRKALGVGSATLSYVTDDTYVFEAVDGAANVDIQAGETVPLEDTVCKRVIETEQALVRKEVPADDPELADSAVGVSSYLGVPVFLDGEIYGTFCFYDTDPRSEEFTDWDFAFVELLSNWVSSELERRRRERALHAARTDRGYGEPSD